MKELLSKSDSPDESEIARQKVVIEILAEGQECPFCHFAKLKRDGNQIVCPICGYGFILNVESIQDSP